MRRKTSAEDRVTVTARHLADALREILPSPGTSDIAARRVTVALAPRNQLSLSRGRRSVLAPAREVSGFWFDSVAVDRRALAFVGHLFQPTQSVEIIVSRTELVMHGAGFRLCIKRLGIAAPRTA